jgi:iron complex transport system ATP-binding protein
VIEALDIHRRRGGLRGISLQAQAGACTAILGPNGAGKSTLLDVLAGRAGADSGAVRLFDRRLEDWPVAELATRRAFLPQAAEVAFPMSIWEIVALGRAPHRRAGDPQADATAIEAALRMTDAWHLRHRLYQRTSGGERQRVQLARAIAQIWRHHGDVDTPCMLLLDEPTASLDPGHRLAVMRLLRELASSGIGILIAMHDLNDALHFADHVVLLDKGRLAGSGAPQEVLSPSILTRVYGVTVEWLRRTDGEPVIAFA